MTSTRRHQTTVTIRLDDGPHAELATRAKSRGLTLTAYARQALFSHLDRAATDERLDEIQRLIVERPSAAGAQAGGARIEDEQWRLISGGLKRTLCKVDAIHAYLEELRAREQEG